MELLGILALVVLVLAGVPIFLAIFVCSMILLVVAVGIDPVLPMSVMFGRITHITLLAVPLFILMGQILALGGGGPPLIRLMNAFMGHIPGGPAYALIIGNMMLAAMCSSPLAGIAGFGPVMVPLMLSLGYSERFTIGLLICSAVLEPLIPPSILPIMYAFIAGPIVDEPMSVITLWTASILPGVLLAFLLGVTVYIHTRRGHFQRLPRADWTERWQALKEGWAILLMPGVVLGPLYGGYATPTESAAIGLLYIILISIFVYRGLNLKNAWQASAQTALILGMVFCILMGALLLTVALSYTRLPFDIADWLVDQGLPWYVFLMANLFLFILMGMFLDAAAITLISVPLLLPAVQDLGISPVTYGIFSFLAVNLAMITPPYGMLIFATMGILNKPYEFIVRSCLLFFPALVLGMLICTFWSDICTWLPEVTGR